MTGLVDRVEGAAGTAGSRDLSAPVRRGRKWLPLWLRVAIVPNGRGVRLTLPLFLLFPLALVGFILILPLASVAVALISIRRREALSFFTKVVVFLSALAGTILLRGRGTGFWVKDQDTEIGFWLS